MQFTIPFLCLLFVFTAKDAAALPTTHPAIVTLPLQPVRRSPTSLHPQVRLQQRMNRSFRRFARMSGREVPTDADLWHNLHRRMHILSRDSGGVEPVENATNPTAPDSLGVDIEDADIGYFTVIQVGTPPRDFRVTIDSGSADFWVEGENCQADSGGRCATDHTVLSENTSSTYVDTKKPWSITYGTGDVAGNIVTDNVVIDGLALNNHTFGVAFKESSDFSSYAIPYDGLIGLALSTLSNQQVITPIEALAKKGLLKEAITSYKISRVADNKHDGEITFGGLDASKFDAKTLITIPNVSKIGFWEGAVDAVGLDGVDMGLQNRTAIFDTGTSGILAPNQDAETIHANIDGAKSDGQGGFTLPCTTNATISMTFGGATFTIDPRDLADGPVDDNDPTGDCVSGISSDVDVLDGPAQWLLGDTFLKNVYLSTNVDKNSVSLAKLV